MNSLAFRFYQIQFRPRLCNGEGAYDAPQDPLYSSSSRLFAVSLSTHSASRIGAFGPDGSPQKQISGSARVPDTVYYAWMRIYEQSVTTKEVRELLRENT